MCVLQRLCIWKLHAADAVFADELMLFTFIHTLRPGTARLIRAGVICVCFLFLLLFPSFSLGRSDGLDFQDEVVL